MQSHHCPKHKRKRDNPDSKMNMASPTARSVLPECLTTMIIVKVCLLIWHFQYNIMNCTSVKVVAGFLIGKVFAKYLMLVVQIIGYVMTPAKMSRNVSRGMVYSMAWSIMIFSMFTCVHAPNPNQVRDYDVLPGMRRWNGIPFNEFSSTWWIALCTALGSIAQDGWTLLQTATGGDAGAPGVGGAAQVQQQSANRNVRLFNAILNYIEPSCSLYRYIVMNFNLNGRGLFAYIEVYGNLPYSSNEIQRLESEWEAATIAKVNIQFTTEAVFLWEEWVKNMQRKLGKTNAQARTKYLRGFPSSFDVVIVPESMSAGNGNYVFPANFPAHHPNNGNADPAAGEADIHAMALAFSPTWNDMIQRGLIQPVPRGMTAHSAEASGVCSDCSDSDDDESAKQIRRMTAAQLARIICMCCGGIGHFARSGKNKCLTLLNGVNVPKEDLLKVKYPNGLEPPQMSNDRKTSQRETPQRDEAKQVKKEYKRRPASKAKVVTEEPVQDAVQEEESSSDSDSGDPQVKWAVAFDSIIVS